MNFTIIFENNNKDFLDFLEAVGPMIIGVGSIVLAYIANIISSNNLKQQKEQFEIQLKEEKNNFNIQLEEQRKQWKYDTLLKFKIETIFKIRKLFQKFQKETLIFIGLFLPDGLRKGTQQLFGQDCLDMNADGVTPLFMNTRYYDTFEEILLNNLKTANELYILLESNDIFLNNNELRTEPIFFVKGFMDFYIDLIMTKKYFNNILVKNSEGVHEIKFNKDFNEYFLKFMHMRLPYTKNNIRTHVFFMNEPSIFSVNKQDYTDANIKQWAGNFKVLYSISQTIHYWLAITMADINKLTEKYLLKEELEALNE